MIIEKNGNLLEAMEDIKAHQVNCQGVMNSGIAEQIKEKYPIVFGLYQACCRSFANNKETLMGHIQPVKIKRGENNIICNIFSQLEYGYDGRQYTDTEALKTGLYKLKNLAKENNLSVALPYKIGSDRGGADWGEVKEIIEEVFSDYNVTLYKYNPKEK